MEFDEEGFQYPQIDIHQCVDCGLCKSVCPIINQSEPKEPIDGYAAINPNETIRLESSSGGIFSMLAENIINQGGVVFGAKFNDKWEVVHNYTETIDGLADFRGSKYVQSRIENCYIKTKEFLETGRDVLFSGTPCQIAGLKRFLRKDYSNLLTIDIICHGVPSPMVWNNYLKSISDKIGEIGHITFRWKLQGWKNYCFRAMRKDTEQITNSSESVPVLGLYSPYRDNEYFKAFLHDLSLRPSCYACPAKSGRSGSDITIADFWGIQHILPDFDDDKGCNLVLVNTQKGANAFNNCNCLNHSVDINVALKHNQSYMTSSRLNKYRGLFFTLIKKHEIKDALAIIAKKQQPSLLRRIASKSKQLLIMTYHKFK